MPEPTEPRSIRRWWGEEPYIFDSIEFDEQVAIYGRRPIEKNRPTDWDKLKHWSEKYSGVVRRSWGVFSTKYKQDPWEEIVGDIHSSVSRGGLVLDEIERLAAIEYPMVWVPSALGRTLILTPTELFLLAVNRSFDQRSFDDVTRSQKDKGLNTDIIERAQRIFKQASEKVPPQQKTD